MTDINSGYAILNDARIKASDRVGFCLLGMPRGGTTMTAKLIQSMGIHIGDNLPVTAEDPEFVEILRETKPDTKKLNQLVEERFVEHKRWGFKAPYRNHWELLHALPSCRFVIVFRDVLAVANRNRISADADLLESMAANLSLQNSLIKFAGSVKSPVFLFSYEKAVIDPEPIIGALLKFCGASSSEANRAKLKDVIKPNDAQYIDTMALQKRSDMSANLDIATRQRVAGWVRKKSGKPVKVEVLFDGEVVAKTVADVFRKDLAAHFGDHGKYGFDVTVDATAGTEGPLVVTVRNQSDGHVFARKTL